MTFYRFEESEAELQQTVAEYIALAYPDVLFHSDFGSGVKLAPKQATLQRKQNAGRRGWPDLFIAEPTPLAHGLFLELKKEGTKLYKRNGAWANEHIAEQAEVLQGLRVAGYAADFAIGFKGAKGIIDNYLSKSEWTKAGKE